MNTYNIYKKIFIIAVVVLSIILALPNAISTPNFMPNKTVKLGLDLQGGAHLLLQVEKKPVLEGFYSGLGDRIRVVLRKDRIGYKKLKSTDKSLSLSIRNSEKLKDALKLTKKLAKDVEVTTAGNKITYKLTEAGVEKIIIQVIGQTIKIIRRRIDGSGTQEPLIQRQGIDRIVVQLPGVENPDEIKLLLGKTAKMTFHLVDDKMDINKALNGQIPANRILYADENGNAIILEKRVYVSGENLIDAQPSYSNNQPVVSFRFDTNGARKFGSLTSKNTGKRLAIVLDGKVISAPNINEPILGGRGVISGNFSVESAGELALLLRAGALPAPLTIVEERTVGPGLGADSIEAGKMASILGLVLVIMFMNIVYRRFGTYATVALVVNMVIIVAVLTFLQATLTLPGIAGIVLTIGMAVDANVLIFERIREEFNNGAKVYQAVDKGFSSAFLTIVDANITGLIAGLLLYVFGSGPVQGFAVTLSIGIVASMFSAIMITRWLLINWVNKNNPSTLPKGF